MALYAWAQTIQTDTGDVAPGAEIEVRTTAGGTPLASIFSDRGGAAAKANPFTTSGGGDGLASFFAARGSYTVKATKDGSSQTWNIDLGPSVDVQASALDSTAGQLLAVGAFGLGAGDAPQITDFETTLRPGFYRYAEDTVNGGPGPGASYNCSALVVRGSSLGAVTIWAARQTSAAANQKAWVGTQAQSGDPVIWREIYQQASVLGSVSQAGGVPTGTLFERGSGANGNYMRAADGLQICAHRLAAGSGADTRWTFPAAFAAAPQTQITAISSLVRIGMVAPPATTTTYVDFNCLDAAGARQTNTCMLTAIGRWF